MPGGMYECGRLPPGFTVDAATCVIVPTGTAHQTHTHSHQLLQVSICCYRLRFANPVTTCAQVFAYP